VTELGAVGLRVTGLGVTGLGVTGLRVTGLGATRVLVSGRRPALADVRNPSVKVPFVRGADS